MAQRSSLQIPLSFWWLFLFGFLPACASLLSPSPDPEAGVLSKIGATCTVINPQGTVVQQPVARRETEEVRSEECPIPAGEHVKIVGIGTGTTTRQVFGLGETHCYGEVPAHDLGQCKGGKVVRQRSPRIRTGGTDPDSHSG
jgi:hypothetical protein